MAITVGTKIPDVAVHTMGPNGPKSVRTGEVLGTGKVVLFAVPGAFTPGCSKVHLPGYVAGFDSLKAAGVDTVACVAVNDVFVMQAWADAQGASNILMLADGNAEFTEAMGLEADMSGFGLGTRSQRYSAVIEDGVLKSLEVDEGGAIEASACQATLARL